MSWIERKSMIDPISSPNPSGGTSCRGNGGQPARPAPAESMTRPRIRFSLRSKRCVALSMMPPGAAMGRLPYVQEMERFLLESQKQTVMATAQAVGTARMIDPSSFGLPSRETQCGGGDTLAAEPNEATGPPVGRDPGGRRRRAQRGGGDPQGARPQPFAGYGSQIANLKVGSLVPAAPSHRRNRSSDGGWLQQSWHRLLASAGAASRRAWRIHRAVDEGCAGAQPRRSHALLGASSAAASNSDGVRVIVLAAQPDLERRPRWRGRWWWRNHHLILGAQPGAEAPAVVTTSVWSIPTVAAAGFASRAFVADPPPA